MPGDEGGGRRSQKDNRAGYFDRLSDTMQGGDAVNHILAKRRLGKTGFRTRSVDKRRRYGVYIDVVLAPLHRQAPG